MNEKRTGQYIALIADHIAQFLPKNPNEAERVVALLELKIAQQRELTAANDVQPRSFCVG